MSHHQPRNTPVSPQRSQAMPEYALVLAVVASGSALLFSQLGGQVTAVLMQVTSSLH